MNNKTTLVGMFAVIVAMAAVFLVPGNVFAAKPDNPSGWGDLTSGAASSDGQLFGDHASSQDTPRVGIPNALGGDPEHPSVVGEFLCTNIGGFPCPPS
jgi:hypothetical protein